MIGARVASLVLLAPVLGVVAAAAPAAGRGPTATHVRASEAPLQRVVVFEEFSRPT